MIQKIRMSYVKKAHLKRHSHRKKLNLSCHIRVWYLQVTTIDSETGMESQILQYFIHNINVYAFKI